MKRFYFKHMGSGTMIVPILLTVIAFLTGLFSLLLLRSYFAVETARQQTQTVISLQKGKGGLAKYGTIDHVDTATRTLVMRSFNSFTPNEQPTVLTIHIPADAVIARQTLIQNNGAFDSLSTRVSTLLSNINSGDRAVAFITVDPSGNIEASLVLFGSPL